MSPNRSVTGRRPSLAARAAVALALTAGFYGLALLIAAGLAGLLWFDLTQVTRPHPKLLFGVGSSLGLLAWSLYPRRDRFEPPGPQLDPAQHPELFRLIDSVAQAVGRSRPHAVYLIGDVNAWVCERGGWMGLGGRPVMAIGEPLLQVLTRAQLRAVIAHEFGHFEAGDTKLGPWVYKTREALERTLEQLDETALHAPFHLYARLFMRVSLGVSRAQEYAADALAARLCGSTAAIDALKQVERAAAVHDAYWEREVVPVLDAGFLPPLTEGFGRYLASPSVAAWVDRHLAETMADERDDAERTHPSLAHRIEALEALPPGAAPSEEPALSLVSDLVELERIRLELINGSVLVGALTPVAWDETPERVWLPRYARAVGAAGRLLDGLALEDLAEPDLFEARMDLVPPDWLEDSDRDSVLARARWTAGAAAILRLAERGFVVTAEPGSPVLVHHTDGETLDVQGDLDRLAAGTLDPAVWSERLARFGAGSLSLVRSYQAA